MTSSVSDNFGARVSNGPVVQPDWMKAALAKPLALRSEVNPSVTTLPNGLHLLVQRVATNPTVFIDGIVRTSPSFDPPGKEGLGQITSSLMDWGSAKYDYDAQHKVGDDLAADLSFGTSFSAHGRAGDFPKLLEVLADDVRHPLLPADKFALVRSQLAALTGRRALQAGYEAQRLFDEALYPAGDPVLHVADRTFARRRHARRRQGLRRAVRAPRPHHAGRRRGRRSGPGRPASHGAVRRLVRQRSQARSASAADPAAGAADADRHDRRTGRDRRAGAPALPRTSPDYDSLSLANAIYGGNGSLDSRLFREVRERRGLVYGASSELDANRDRGTFTVSFSAVPSKIDAAEAVVRAELRRMQTDDVGADELARAKTRIVATQLNAEQATSTIAGDLLQNRIGRSRTFVLRDPRAALRGHHGRRRAARGAGVLPPRQPDRGPHRAAGLKPAALRGRRSVDLISPAANRDGVHRSAAIRRRPSSNCSTGATQLSRSQPSRESPKMRPGIATTPRCSTSSSAAASESPPPRQFHAGVERAVDRDVVASRSHSSAATTRAPLRAIPGRLLGERAGFAEDLEGDALPEGARGRRHPGVRFDQRLDRAGRCEQPADPHPGQRVGLRERVRDHRVGIVLGDVAGIFDVGELAIDLVMQHPNGRAAAGEQRGG